ncbi:N-acyl-D-amino-acid deacylase family protein [Kordiimonas pumila]|uniref:Amidohydrolase family protein n=1 Tax=Kordiimonas pumila TaxID=2161677 RepID=A0ABV7D7H9_9PROT|nr:amidohydrolase family protein [Kordiimonas pumila]
MQKNVGLKTALKVLSGALSVSYLTAGLLAADYDLVIKNGIMVDGTGVPGVAATIGIKDGLITYVGDAESLDADEVVDAKGLVVSPGFVDAHNHSESVYINPADHLNTAYLLQGVTTTIVGNDGFLNPEQIKGLQKYIAEYGTGTNVAAYVGHNGVRRVVMGSEQRAPTSEELAKMKALVHEGMEEGAIGFSTGLMYDPGKFSDTAEVIALAKEAAPYGGTYDSHIRNPVHDLIGSATEAIEIGRSAGIGAKISHAKLVGLPNKSKMPEFLKLVEDARSEGLNVVTDQYPYNGAATSFLWDMIALPEQFAESQNKDDAYGSAKDRATLKTLLAVQENLPSIAAFNEAGGRGFSWVDAVGYTAMRIVDAPENPELVGKHISELASEWAVSGFEALARIIVNSSQPILMTLGSVEESNVQKLLVQPWNMVSSDGAWADASKELRMHHPRSTGSFPRVVGHYARDLKLMSMEEAIRKMTSFPVAFMGLGKRGIIREGYVADIAIFNPDEIVDRSTWVDPDLMSVGMVDVIVAGKLVLKDGKPTGTASGTFIKLAHD